MKKPSSKIRQEIEKLQDQLRTAEAREAERIGRIALRSGLGEIKMEESKMQAAFEAMALQFRHGNSSQSKSKGASDLSVASPGQTGQV